MRLCLPTTWEPDYLERLAALSAAAPGDDTVFEVFGSVPRSVTGSGRDGALVPDVTPAAVADHVQHAHRLGLRFNYLMNAPDLGGAEYRPDGLARLRRYVAWVRDIGADSITVTVPFLLELVAKEAPQLEINVSTIAHVDTVRAAQLFESLGAHRLTLSLMVNRDLTRLAALQKSVSAELELLANELCLYHCPHRDYHYSLMGQGSRGANPTHPVEYPHLRCTLTRLQDPAELLKARFIRPEDVATYEGLGVHLIKLAGRGRPASDLLGTAQAYLARRYDGNLVDLTDLGTYRVMGQQRPWLHIDNNALDGLLQHTAGVDCETQCGAACTYCDKLAEKAVRITYSDGYLAALKRCQAKPFGDE